VTSEATIRQRRRAALIGGGAVAAIIVIAVVAGGGGGEGSSAEADKPKLAELPRGGRTLFPNYQVIAYYGAPQDNDLGALGIGAPDGAGRRLLEQTSEYHPPGARKVLPAMELIAEIAQGEPGDDGLYNAVQPDRIIRRYLKAARKIKALLILDIQPGHASLFGEAMKFEKWLREPDVSLALDPEWHTPGAVPGTVIGSMEAREVNAVSFWLEALVHKYKLPQKLLVVHRFTENMIVGEELLKPRRDVKVTINVDGFGENPIKVAKYREFAQRRAGLYNGFKIFYHEDPHPMEPSRLEKLRPPPELVVYE
jgi:hypothetical protein